jgi:hypothetical protein
MPQVHVRAPDGSIGTVDESEYQSALDSGYTNVSQEEADAAQAYAAEQAGPDAAVTQGLLQAPADYSTGKAFVEKAASALTFGQMPGLDSPEARARGQRYQEEHPVGALGAEALGQLPGAVLTGGLGAAAVKGVAGRGLAARVGGRVADWGVNAAAGGVATEAEETRLSGEDFSWTDAAVTGLAGEAIGRGAAVGFSSAIGASRNLLAKSTQKAVAQDTASSLSKGGILNDYRVAHHADQYQAELSKLAADDLDALETSFAEVSRQDRKRARIVRVVEDNPEAQAAVRQEAQAGLADLYDALSGELADAPGPAKTLLKQLDDRMDALAEGGTSGKKLWRQLDENRQALQEYIQDVSQAYENAPGSAWLSRDGLAKLEAAEKATREALLREDVWGREAAAAQAAYNVPFNEKYFPTVKTVRGKLMLTSGYDARGFPVHRGDPGKVAAFFRRAEGDPDSARLAEQFSEYLDGVEAIAKAGAGDTPKAARDTLEAVRRLRKAAANAQQVQAAAARTARVAGRVGNVADIAGGIGGAIAGGPFGAAVAFGAVRGARAGEFLQRALQRLGVGAGKAESMAQLLGRDALPGVAAKDAPFVDDILDAGTPTKPPPSTPPSGGGGPGAMRGLGGYDAVSPGVPEGGGGNLSPSILAEARGAGAGPAPAPRAPAPQPAGSRTMPVDEAEPLANPSTIPPSAARTRPADPMDDRGVAQAVETDRLNTGSTARQAEARRLEALSQGEFAAVVRQLKATGQKEAKEFAEQLESSLDELVEDGLVDATPDVRAGARTTEPPALDEVDQFYENRRAQADADRAARTAAGPDAAPTKAIQDAGLQIRMGGDRVAETMETLFGAGKAPTPEQWAQLAPLKTIAELGPVKGARIDVLGDSFIWSAEGVTTMTKPHTTWDGIYDPGGYEAETWSISRTFSRDEKGRLEVHHDHFMVRGDLQGGGAGSAALKSMMGVYRKLGVDVVTVDSVEVGKYLWPAMGFNCSKDALKNAKRAYVEWFTSGMEVSGAAIPTTAAQAAEFAARRAEAEKAIASIQSLPSLANMEFGKNFLLANPGPWNFGLRMDLTDDNPFFHLMRGRLDVAAAALLGLGGALEGERKDPPDAAKAAEAGIPPQVAAFGATAALLKSGRAKLVGQVAKRMFAAGAEPALRTVARLGYSRSQLAARQEEFHAWQADPQELVRRVAEGLRDAPPEAAGKAAAGIFAAAAFLKEKLPQSSKPNPVALRGVPVSAEAAAKYARYEQAALEPGEALREASEGGYLAPETLETLQALYADLLAEFRVAAYQAVREGGPASGLSIQAKTQYARLFDGDGAMADPAFGKSATTMVQMAYEEQAQTQNPKTGAGPRPGVSQVAAAVAAPTPWRAA